MKTTSLPLRWWDLPAAALITAALVTAAARLVVTEWTGSLSIIETIVFFGAIAGLALGQSKFSPRLAGFLGLVYGLFVVPWQLGLTIRGHLLWSVRMDLILGRLVVIITQLIRHDVVQDSLLFVVLMGVLFWVLGAYGGYTLTRYGNAWRAILPAGLALFAIHSFDPVIPRRAWYLAIFLFFSLVLVARMAYLQQHSRWQQSRTALPPHLGLDFIRFSLLATGFIVLFSWTVPALANSVPAVVKATQPMRQYWNEVRDRMDNAFASLKSTVGVVSDYYGNSVLMGRGNKLTDSQVAVIIPRAKVPDEVRLYWRAKAYNTYADGQWLNTIAGSRAFNPKKDEIAIPKDEGRWNGTFEFHLGTYASTLYTPAQPFWVDRPAQAEVAANSDNTLDLTAFRATPPLNPGQTYVVQASLSDAKVTDLRASGTNYPDWVADRYLQVPDAITERTRQLAENITASQDTPYDKVVAITNYLRNNIQYSETVPERPARQEAIDWFLFDLRSGFCNYYASAEVILLRTIGIPARIAFGYAQGEKLQDGSYLVRQRDAHAWPEVYFPGLGWVEFEPTASQDPIIRTPGENSQESTRSLPDNVDEEAQRQQQLEELRAQREDRLLGSATDTQPGGWSWTSALLWGGSLLAIAGLAFAGWKARNRINLQAAPILMETTLMKAGIRPPSFLRRWARWAALSPLSKSYLEINQALTRLGNRPKLTATPAERAGALGELVPLALEPAYALVQEYQAGIFGPSSDADLEAAYNAGRQIRSLSYKALFKTWLARLQKPRLERRPWLNSRLNKT